MGVRVGVGVGVGVRLGGGGGVGGGAKTLDTILYAHVDFDISILSKTCTSIHRKTDTFSNLYSIYQNFDTILSEECQIERAAKKVSGAGGKVGAEVDYRHTIR